MSIRYAESPNGILNKRHKGMYRNDFLKNEYFPKKQDFNWIFIENIRQI